MGRHIRRFPVIPLCVAWLVSPQIGQAQAKPFQGLESYIESAMKDWKIPGVAVGIVRNDSVVFAKGFGVRKVGSPETVDTHTLFALASDSKALTGMLLAMLVDDGKIKWDAPLITYLPALRFADDALTRELTIRDALTHRSGLARADLLWAAGWPYDSNEILRRIRFLKPSWSMRSHYGYSNLMYLAAGEAAAAAAGKPWDQLMRERIFQALGMNETSSCVTALSSLSNVALPHGMVDGVVAVVRRSNIAPAAPAGAINSNVADMTKWLRFQLDSGRVNGKRLVSRRNFIETHTPQTVIRIDSAYRAFNPFTHLRSYALGWQVMDYRDREILTHAGNLSGMAAMVGLLPEERTGVVVLTNLEGNALRESIMYKVFDMALGAPPRDWSKVSLTEQASLDSIDAKTKRDQDARRVMGTQPSLPLSRYAGVYADSLYGTVAVRQENDHLVLDFAPNMVGDLEHWHYDTFRVTWRDHRDGTNLVTFSLDMDGKIDTMSTDIGGPPEETPRMKRVSDIPAATSANGK